MSQRWTIGELLGALREAGPDPTVSDLDQALRPQDYAVPMDRRPATMRAPTALERLRLAVERGAGVVADQPVGRLLDLLVTGGGIRAMADAQAPPLMSMGEANRKPVPRIGRTVRDVAQDNSAYLHGSSESFDELKLMPQRGNAIYLSPIKKDRGGAFVPNKTQAEHIASGPFGGHLYAVSADQSKLRVFNPLNDAEARAVYERAFPGRDVTDLVPYWDMPDLVPLARERGFNAFRVYEPAVQGESLAVSDPSALRVIGKGVKDTSGEFVDLLKKYGLLPFVVGAGAAGNEP